MSPALSPPAGVRLMIIVARDRPHLYEYLRAAFGGFPDVDVIVDRRIEGPSADDGVASDPGPGILWEPDVYDELTLRGFVIKRYAVPDAVDGSPSTPLGSDLTSAGLRRL